MWKCPQCQTSNVDVSNNCVQCGTTRPGSRFGSAPPRQVSYADQTVRTPMISTAAQPSGASEPENAAASSYPDQQAVRFSGRPVGIRRRRAGFLVILCRIVGLMLTVLLPLLTALLAWKQYDALSQALVPLLLNEAPEGILPLVCYAALSVLAVCFSALPGLWTLLLARESRR